MKPDTSHILLTVAAAFVIGSIFLQIAGRVDESTNVEQATYEQANIMAAGIAGQNAAELYK